MVRARQKARGRIRDAGRRIRVRRHRRVAGRSQGRRQPSVDPTGRHRHARHQPAATLRLEGRARRGAARRRLRDMGEGTARTSRTRPVRRRAAIPGSVGRRGIHRHRRRDAVPMPEHRPGYHSPPDSRPMAAGRSPTDRRPCSPGLRFRRRPRIAHPAPARARARVRVRPVAGVPVPVPVPVRWRRRCRRRLWGPSPMGPCWRCSSVREEALAKARAVRCGGGHAVGGVGLPFAQLPLFHDPCGMLAVFVRVHEAARDLALG